MVNETIGTSEKIIAVIRNEKTGKKKIIYTPKRSFLKRLFNIA